MWLDFRGVTCQYGSHAIALKNVTFRIGIGLWAAVGPNGSGKSTLLRCAAGILPPVRGGLLWNGQDAYKQGSQYRWHVGYAPQGLSGRSGLTVRSYLVYLAALKGIRPSTYATRVEHVLALSALSGCAERPITTLSGGLKSRLVLAQAMLNDPDLLILDEPLAGLDPIERIRFRQLVVTLARERIVLVATNIVTDFEGVTDGTIRLRESCLESFA